jgi:hypothetical protein
MNSEASNLSFSKKLKHIKTQKQRNRSLGDRRLEEKTPAGRYRCDIHPFQRLYIRHHDEEGVVHLWTTGL